MIYIPILLLLVQTAGVAAAGLRLQRLTWIVALSLAALSLVVLVFLAPFLPAAIEIPLLDVSGYSIHLDYTMDQSNWSLILLIFVLYFSVIVYHPTEMATGGGYHKQRYTWSMMAAILVAQSASVLSMIFALVLYDVVSLIPVSGRIGAGGRAEKRIDTWPIRAVSILLLPAYLFSGSEAGFISTAVVSVLMLASVLLRYIALPEQGPKADISCKFLFFLDATVGAALLMQMQMDVSSQWLLAASGAAAACGACWYLLAGEGGRRSSRAFIAMSLGMVLIQMYLSPEQSRTSLTAFIAMIISCAVVIFMQSIYEKHHRTTVWVLGILLLGFPLSLTTSWTAVWAESVQNSSSWILVVVMPVFQSVLVYSVIGYVKYSLKKWPDSELITRTLHLSAPVVAIVSGWSIVIWKGWGNTSGLQWIYAAVTAALVFALYRAEHILRSAKMELLPGIERVRRRIRARLCVRWLEGKAQTAASTADDYLEGDASFLWIIFSIVVLALIGSR